VGSCQDVEDQAGSAVSLVTVFPPASCAVMVSVKLVPAVGLFAGVDSA